MQYMASLDCRDAAAIVMLGAPMDYTTSFRPGARFGPNRVREVSYGLEEYSDSIGLELADTCFFDAGDVECPFGDAARSLEAIGREIKYILEDGKIPFMIGGEHLVSLPAIAAAKQAYPDLAVIQFDAHADLRCDYMNERLSHATVMRRVLEYVDGASLYQLGIRSGTKEEYEYARKHTQFYPERVLDVLPDLLLSLEGRPIYVSLDVDVIDPAFAPGTGTPEPGGISSAEMLQAVRGLRGSKVVGMDVVELSPLVDHSDVTAVLTAKLVREGILAIGRGGQQ